MIAGFRRYDLNHIGLSRHGVSGDHGAPLDQARANQRRRHVLKSAHRFLPIYTVEFLNTVNLAKSSCFHQYTFLLSNKI
jgi:hypothetical protein